jgi:2-polyprenyl-3-methyl-5-hydroxy-6-metoxy-1,4-benzoquinol methylase
VNADELFERLRQDTIGTFELLALYLGERLGLYRALSGAKWTTPAELATRTGTDARYVREWLEHQAVSGFLEVDDPAAEPEARRFRLPPGHEAVLVDQDHLMYLGYEGVNMVRAARPMPALVEAFRTGDPTPPLAWEPEGRAEFNRAIFLSLLGREWLPGMPEIDARLRADPPAKVGDVGCGTGWSSIAMARAYPAIRIDGYDLDPDAIAAAREHAEAEGLSDRVHFVAQDAAALPPSSRYDLVTVFEALHDLARPVDVLRGLRGLLASGGTVLVADEPTAERFEVPASDEERYLYGWSLVSCLPSAMGPGSAGTGAVMRPATLRRYAEQAGFGSVDVLFENDYWRFYLLRP